MEQRNNRKEKERIEYEIIVTAIPYRNSTRTKSSEDLVYGI